MGSRSRLIAVPAVVACLGGFLGLGLAIGGCKTTPSDVPAPDAGARPVASASAAPVDKLAPDELVEGKASAFGLKLPMVMTIESQIQNEITVVGPVAPKRVADYVAARVRGGTAQVARVSIFNDVRLPSDPARPLHIEILASGTNTRMTVRDDTVVVTPISPQEAMKRNGVGPDNKLIDPEHMQ